jgi:hypothetical protein
MEWMHRANMSRKLDEDDRPMSGCRSAEEPSSSAPTRSRRRRTTALEHAPGRVLWGLVLGIPLALAALDGWALTIVPAFDSVKVVLPSAPRGKVGPVNAQHFSLLIPDAYGIVSYLQYSVMADIVTTSSFNPRLVNPLGRCGSVDVVVSIGAALTAAQTARTEATTTAARDSATQERGNSTSRNEISYVQLSSHLPLRAATVDGSAYNQNSTSGGMLHSLRLYAVGGVSVDGPLARRSQPRHIVVEGEINLSPDVVAGDEYSTSVIFKFASPKYFLCVVALRLLLCVATAGGAWLLYRQRLHLALSDSATLHPLPEAVRCFCKKKC